MMPVGREWQNVSAAQVARIKHERNMQSRVLPLNPSTANNTVLKQAFSPLPDFYNDSRASVEWRLQAGSGEMCLLCRSRV